MRHPIFLLPALVALAACGDRGGDAEVARALDDINVIDETNLNDVMMTVADPGEAVSYFQRASDANPERVDLRRGLAQSLVRAGRIPEAVAAYTQLVALPAATEEDRVAYAGALIRNNSWDRAESVLDAIPPTVETFDRYRFEAMVADSNEEWSRADSFYETALGLTTTPAGVLNNWGYSNLTRGNYAEAERFFADALRHEPNMFTAKNNLVLARGAQRNYDLPVIPMTQVERAQLLYTMALTAIKQNDLNIGRSLLQDAIDTHPQHFEEAVRAMRALDQGA
ncbi:tetratricopeptide repeat protein [Wenxinia saemankumensis]|uniref:Tetratricopeptide repeat-containing protein n=1 Tax=Wenxinia saemankumensis TaxID=1447782 RepID=A0A1M6GUD0_9RHOB|nr:tetratricopeptide repeat protein [Wenxinia saemankumensis]SHJ13598.1 Tetratricopeptide repeat-containing protein [Wenxinia saemankumensis]